MPPKRAKAKLHQLAVELPKNSIIQDTKNKKQYSIGRQFASGGFGRIYTCNEVGSKKELAIKVEPYGNGPLFTEVNVFIRILKPEQIEEFLRQKKLKRLGVPSLISCGIHQHGEEKLRFLVMPKYSISLENIREKLTTLAAFDVWTIARCMLESLDYIHGKNYTHADIKAANILLEHSNDFSSCVLVDYGLARMASSNQDRPDKKRAHNGSVFFTSCDAHRGCHPSYRGDLEILAYNIMYWLSGSLPWQTYESEPSKVHQLKEAFLSDLSTNLNKQLKENGECVTPLKDIFTIAQKTSYSVHLNFSDLYKIVDNVLKRFRNDGRKRSSEEPLSDVLEVNEKNATKRKKSGNEPKNEKKSGQFGKLDITECDRSLPKNETPHRTEPTVSRLIKSKGKLGGRTCTPRVYIRRPAISTSSPNVDSQKEQQSLRSSKEQATVDSPIESSSATRARERRIVEKDCSLMHSPIVSKTDSPRLSSEGKVPGLSVRRAPCSPVNLKPSEHVNNMSSNPLEVNVKRSAEKVSSDVKRSPNKLRKIPGMQNFRRGRRSIVIDQITKKYQKMAQDKRSNKS